MGSRSSSRDLPLDSQCSSVWVWSVHGSVVDESCVVLLRLWVLGREQAWGRLWLCCDLLLWWWRIVRCLLESWVSPLLVVVLGLLWDWVEL